MIGWLTNVLPQLDLGRGLIAVAISIALFSVVETNQNPLETGSFDLRVDLQGQPSGLVIMTDSSSRAVSVRISGPRDSMTNLRPSALRAYVDLSKAAPGLDQYPVMVDLPDPKLRVVDITPSRISVRLDQNIDRQVPVKLVRLGSVPFGYEGGEADIDPTVVTVSGPSTVVRNVDAANVEYRLDGVTSTVDSRYPAIPVDAQGQAVTSDGPTIRINPPTVRVRVAVEQQLSYKTVGVQPAITGSVQSGYVIEGVTTEPPAITVVGAPLALASVNFAQTEQIDATDANATFARQVSVIVPEGVSVVQDGPVRVTLRVAPLSLTQSVSAVPSPMNLTPGLQVVSALPSVQIVLQGPPSALRGVQPSDLRVTVNLAGMAPGPNQAPVEVVAPPGLTVQTVNPSIITVTLGDTQTTPVPVPPTQPPSTATATPAVPTRIPVVVTFTPTPTEEPVPTVVPTRTTGPTPSRTPQPVPQP
jgi:YbbR domain-containing protein